MKSFKTTIIVLLLLVLLIAGYFTVRHFLSKNTGDTPEDESLTFVSLFELDTEKINRIEAKSDNVYILYKTGDKWICQNNQNIPVDGGAVSDILTGLCEIKGNIIAVDDEKKFESDYAINGESPYTTVFTEDGHSYTIRFGLANNKSTYRFVSVDGKKDCVYRVYETNAKKITVTANTLVRLNAFVFGEDFHPSRLSVKKNNEYVIEASGTFLPAESKDDKDTVTWKVTRPLEIAGNDTALNNLTAYLENAELSELVESGAADIQKYGLDKPLIEYYLVYVSGTQVESRSLILGNKTENADAYYCAVDGDMQNIYLISESLVVTDIKIEDYISGYVYYTMYTDLSEIKINMGTETHTMKYVFEDAEGELKEERYFDGRFVHTEEEYRDSEMNTPEDYFNHLLNALYCIEIGTVDLSEPEDRGEVLCSVTYTLTDGTSVKVEVTKRDESTAYLYKDGKYMCGYMRTATRLYGDYNEYGIVKSIEAVKKAMK